MKKPMPVKKRKVEMPGALWRTRTLEPRTCYHLSLGDLDLWVRYEELEWYVAYSYRHDQSGGGILAALPARSRLPELSWQRWVVGEADAPLLLRPELPLRALVVRPQDPLRLSAGSRIQVFVAIPVSVSILVGAAKPVQLCSLATRVLSNTWFGEPAAGELCYALTSPALSNAGALASGALASGALASGALASGAHEAVCPVSILNHSDGELDFQRLCIRVEHLGIYRGASRLWTNAKHVEYRGEPGIGQVTISEKDPDFEKIEEKLTPARRPAGKTLMTKSFHLLKTLTGF